MDIESSDALPVTEAENLKTGNLSSLGTQEILRLMNDEDALISDAVRVVLPHIAAAVDAAVSRLKNGGRLFYIGTGTSGRLGVLDAAECPPTFGVSPDLVQAVIAGGYEAVYRAVEASEDDEAAGETDLAARGFKSTDVLVGIAASGRTPYTIGGLRYAQRIGAVTVSITCAPNSPITKVAEINIVAVVGPEVIAGSTRLKAGTAQKLVLNMISTATMVKLGYVTGNRMTNLLPRNSKLRARSLRIIMAEGHLDEAAANTILARAQNDPRIALVMIRTKATYEQARNALDDSNGVIADAVSRLNK